MLDECAVRAVRKIRSPKIHDGRLLITYSSLDNRLCIVEWTKSAFGGVESLNKILRQSEFCIANCIGMNITITFHVGLWAAQHLSKVV